VRDEHARRRFDAQAARLLIIPPFPRPNQWSNGFWRDDVVVSRLMGGSERMKPCCRASIQRTRQCRGAA
jgi:hypothetical protein